MYSSVIITTTPLLLIIINYSQLFHVVQYLIEQGEADPNIACSTGTNALYHAAWTNTKNTDLVELLLNNMSVDSINKMQPRGGTPLDVAYDRNKGPFRQKIIELIRSKGGKRNLN